METLHNLTIGSQTNGNHENISHLATFFTDRQRDTIALVNYVCLCGLVSAFGIVTNAINLVIFYTQGLNSTTNISFFAMAVSDLCCLIIQQLFNVYINPLFEELHLPMMYTDVQHLTSCVPRALFSRITCLITVYMTAERCLCVVFPLHIKQIITTKTTKMAVFLIYCLTLVSGIPLYTVHYLGWKFYPENNATFLAMITANDSHSAIALVFFFHAFSGLLSFLAVVILTGILIAKLREKSAWRKCANVQNDKSGTLSLKDKTTMAMVALVASILIICYTPSTMLAVVTVWEPEFSVEGKLYNLFYVLWSFAFLLENINSSVNIFLYLKMSSKYRQTLYKLFPCFEIEKTSNRES